VLSSKESFDNNKTENKTEPLFVANENKKTVIGNLKNKINNFLLTLESSKNNLIALASDKFQQEVVDSNAALAVSDRNYILGNQAEQFAVYFYRTVSGLFDDKATQVSVEEEIESPVTQIEEDVIIVEEPVTKTIERPVTQTTIVNPIQERVIETVVERVVSGVALADLQALNNELRSEIYQVANDSTTQTSNNYQAIALTNKIDNLSSVTINNSTITGGTITGATFSGSTLSLTGTVSAGSG
jgi:hypothetical protein